ncbi:nucleotidyltransferase family protein [Thalassovita sp.]|uniref:nucleotidyltransferase family protein n=1 Tax=Thalassovita sp. TaxID=1979401 RepID=UPI002B27714C|nr:nucleotidyltransferase family protein [Thalassovita sp.]
MDSVGAVILAAGLSRRMEARNKLLLPVGGVPMIRHVVETYLAAVDGEVCVVTGFEAMRIDAVLAGLPVRLVYNRDFEMGQPFSVRAGLLDAPNAAHLLIGLGDQPQLTAANLHALISAHLVGNTAKISIPLQGTQRGNPIIVPEDMRSRLLADKTNPGCAKFTRSNPDLVQNIPLSQSGFCNDIDTPAAFAAFQETPSERV